MIQTSTEFLHSNGIPYELKHLLFKYVHDNIVQLLDKSTMSLHHEIENLYLLTSLSKIGKEYWLPESVLAKYFLIKFLEPFCHSFAGQGLQAGSTVHAPFLLPN